MPDRDRRIMDAENAAKDRYDLCQRILVALNSDNVDEAKSILKADMKIYEDEYLYADEEKEPSIIVESENR